MHVTIPQLTTSSAITILYKQSEAYWLLWIILNYSAPEIL